tara:strand:- start:79 stop:456 length:378 start_codon:yes stop_codon:yes gene_type:complete
VKLTRQERYRAIESNPQHREYKVTMLRKARNRAKKRNIYFNLTLNDFHIGEKCPILGTPFKVGLDNWQNSPSLDRIDNRRGYEKGNVIVVCTMANSIKNQATPSQIKKVADFYEKLYEEKAIDIS